MICILTLVETVDVEIDVEWCWLWMPYVCDDEFIQQLAVPENAQIACSVSNKTWKFVKS